MVALPTGTVTFLYSDIEGSTRRWEEQPAAMRAAVERHFALLRDAIGAHGGHVFRTQGDGLCAAFATAPDALAAALAAQLALHREPWPGGEALRVRMALHTGAAEPQDGDFVGACLNRLGRLLGTGHGGQTLLSRTTYDLVREALPPGAGLRDLGEHRLRDLAAPEQVFQLLHAGLPDAFPPLASLDALPNNLPLQVTSFVGRESELAEVRDLLARSRLLTLTGTGGCGKTRLALQVAAELLDDYPDGVWFVDLAPLADPALVAQAVAGAMGLRETVGRSIAETVVEHARSRRLLVVLDNCEHLVDASARLADALIRGGAGVRILATSREALGIAGEVGWRVPSLPVPGPADPAALPELARCGAVRLFVERAADALPAFALDEGNAAAVAQVCRRLDGIPLALELAAARVRALSVRQIAARLDQRFRLLTGGSRTALPRQQTLAALVGWSYDLLSEPERTLFDRLAVFAGGFTLEAAEDVCGGPDVDVLDLLPRLVEKSLVVAEPVDDGTDRYHLLETLRQYALEKLAARGEADPIRARHAAHYLALAERGASELIGQRFAFWYAWLGAELNNVRAALRWTIDAGEIGHALRVSGAMVDWLYLRSQPAESRRWLTELLAHPRAAAPTPQRGRALVSAARLAHDQLELAPADALLDEAIAILRAAGDLPGVGLALNCKAQVAITGADYPAARTLAAETATIGRAIGDQEIVADASTFAGQADCNLGDFAAAQAKLDEASRYYTSIGWHHQMHILDWQGHVATGRGDFAAARAWYAQSMRQRLTIDRKIGVAYTLSGFAGLAAAQGDQVRAVRLSAAAARLCELSGVPAHRTQEGCIRDRLPEVRAAMGDAAYEAAWSEGRAMTLEEAIADALGDHATG
jgi:predicted ATPase/class 3 adenylate cyclase